MMPPQEWLEGRPHLYIPSTIIAAPHHILCKISLDRQKQFFLYSLHEKGSSYQNNWMEMRVSWDSFNKEIGFLRPWWWIIHLAGIATVYILGHLLWR